SRSLSQNGKGVPPYSICVCLYDRDALAGHQSQDIVSAGHSIFHGLPLAWLRQPLLHSSLQSAYFIAQIGLAMRVQGPERETLTPLGIDDERDRIMHILPA